MMAASIIITVALLLLFPMLREWAAESGYNIIVIVYIIAPAILILFVLLARGLDSFH